MIGAPSRAFRIGAVMAAVSALLWGGSFAMSAEPATKDAPAPASSAKKPPVQEAPAAAPAEEAQPAGASPAESGAKQPPKTGGEGEEADWPCGQKYVAQLSYGTMWAGPPLDDALKSWHQNDGLRELVTMLADETTDEAAGAKAIDEFAAKLGADKQKQLTELFAALFQTMSDKRTSEQEGIKRYFRRQEAQAQDVNKLQAQLRDTEKRGAKVDDPKLVGLKKNLEWNNRVYDERQKLTPYVCQIPLITEQKLGAYARAIQTHLQG